MDVVGRSPTRMRTFAPRRAAFAVLAFALASVLLASPAWAGDSWQPDTSCADKVKMGKSGQMYSWRKGKC